MAIRENFGFYEGQNLVLAFEELLVNNGITISQNSDLESKYLSVFDVLFHFEEIERLAPQGNYRSLFRDFSALYDLGLKVLSVQSHNDFKQLLPHLEKLNGCSVAQNEKSKITDQDANKIIELYVAALCMRFCKNISLDHPQSSAGDNPDVIAEIDGSNWGFACKTIHTKNSQTIYENLEKAIDQIEKSKSNTGIPVINLKNIINHETIWPVGHTFPIVEKPFSFLWADVNSIRESLLKDIGVEELRNLFIGKKSLLGVLFIAQSATSVFLLETMSPTATRLNVMSLFQINEQEFKYEDIMVFQKLNHYMQLAN